jgi:hypothetical protein
VFEHHPRKRHVIGQALNRRNAPCRRRASDHDACTGRFPTADPEAEYRRQISRSNSVFDIDQFVRISRRIGELRPLDIRRPGVIRRPCLLTRPSVRSRQQ